MRDLLKALSRVLLGFLFGALGGERSLERVADAIEGGSAFVTYHCRPKLAGSVGTEGDSLEACASLAIVIQGPIVHKDAFTLETARLYRRHFAGSEIILSTWEDEPASVVRQFEACGITVILNAKPRYAGISNVNMQIASSGSGMRRAKQLGAEYALKTRSDQRMYAPNVAGFLRNVVDTFPLQCAFGRQRKRIVGCSLNTFKYRMYGLSDMLIYGHIDDMLLYWDIGLDERVLDLKQQRRSPSTLRGFAELRVCEVYLATGFLSKIGREVKWTLRDSWSAFAEQFCVIDKESLDLYWPKYGHSEYRQLRYDEDVRMQELTFGEWLSFYGGLEARVIPEELLDVPFD